MSTDTPNTTEVEVVISDCKTRIWVNMGAVSVARFSKISGYEVQKDADTMAGFHTGSCGVAEFMAFAVLVNQHYPDVLTDAICERFVKYCGETEPCQ